MVQQQKTKNNQQMIDLPVGSHFFDHQFDVLVVLFLVVVLSVLLALTAAWPVGLHEDGLRPSDVAATVRAGVAGWILLDGDQGQRNTQWMKGPVDTHRLENMLDFSSKNKGNSVFSRWGGEHQA